MRDDRQDEKAFPPMTIACPYCEHEKEMPASRLPKKPVAATCPSCACRFLFDPAAVQTRWSFARHASDYRIIREHTLELYAGFFRKTRDSAALVLAFFIFYGLMYFIVTAIHYFCIPIEFRAALKTSGYTAVIGTYLVFFPVMAIYTWDFIDKGSMHIIDKLFCCRKILICVAVGYASVLTGVSLVLDKSYMPFALIIPMMVSALIPALLHAIAKPA